MGRGLRLGEARRRRRRLRQWGGLFASWLAGALGLLWLVSSSTTAFASEILIVQSTRASACEEALSGFRRACTTPLATLGPKALGTNVEEVTLAGPDDAPRALRRIEARRPDLIVAVGRAALALVRGLGPPVVYLLVPGPALAPPPGPRVTGVTMTASARDWLAAFEVLGPDVRRIGVVYDSARTGELVAEFGKILQGTGRILVSRQVSSAREVGGALEELAGRVDALWVVPDVTVVTPETLEAHLLVSLERKVPVVTFSRRHLELGATVALDFDYDAMGRQAGELARRVLANPPALPPPEPAGLRVEVNRKMAGKLGLPLQDPRPRAASDAR